MLWLQRMENRNGIRFERLIDDAPWIGDPRALLQRFDEQGYVYFRRLIPAGRVLALRREILEFARKIGWLDGLAPVEEARSRPGLRIGDYEDPEWLGMQAEIRSRPAFWDVADCEEVHRALSAATGRGGFVYDGMNTCRVVSSHPELAALPHQDAHYIHIFGEFFTGWIPFGDCPLELGALAVLPGSHKWLLQPHEGEGIFKGGTRVEEDAVWMSADFEAGDFVLMQQHTIHRTFPNETGNRLRISGDFRYGLWDS